jgi:hypothetical protein
MNEDNNKQKEPKKEEASLEMLLKQNLIISQEILDISRYIKRYVFWRRIISFAQILLILVPIVLGIIYLPPMIERGLDSINSNLSNPLSSIINSNNCEDGQ